MAYMLDVVVDNNSSLISFALILFALMIVLLSLSVVLIFMGLRNIKKNRLIINIPTSTIRSIAMGLVEIKGRAKKPTPLLSPITGTECVLFKYSIKESLGNSCNQIASGNSFYSPFWVCDDTDEIQVFPEGADLTIKNVYRKIITRPNEIPFNLKKIIDEKGFGYFNFGTCSILLTESIIKPDDDVFVIGTAKKPDNSETDYNEVLNKRIYEFKKDPQKMKEIDLNNDGNIDLIEWDKAVHKIKQNVYKELLSNADNNSPNIIIGKGEENTFYISDQSQKDITKKLLLKSFFCIGSGAYILFIFLAAVIIIIIGG